MYYVYRCFDSNDRLLYVGCSDDPRGRVKNCHKKKHWGHRIRRCVATSYGTRAEALEAETEAIQTEAPLFNKLHKAGKGWQGGIYKPLGMPSTWDRVAPPVDPNKRRGKGVVHNKQRMF